MRRTTEYFGIFIFIQFVLAYFLQAAFWNPADYVYTFGGDGAFVYYNMIFHGSFGSGLTLSNMNFPHYESIFLTDAQASMSILFSFINEILNDFLSPEKIIAWSHRFHYLMIGVTGLFVYRSMQLFNIRRSIAIPASIFITLLSPMIMRLNAGHFGLAYPFVFAYVIFFIIQYFHKRQTSPLSFIFLIITILFFGLNNFYIGMINLILLVLISSFYLFKLELRSSAIKVLLASITMVLILYGFIYFTDPGSDRIEIQWGYYSNSVDISSFVYPPTSLLHKALSSFTEVKTHHGETWINLGLIPLITLLFLPIYDWFRNRKIPVKNSFPTIFQAFVFSGLILLLYASAIFYRIPFVRDLFFHEFGILTMFKASARFAWPIYFMAGIMTCFYLNTFLRPLKLNKNFAQVIIFCLILLVWAFETFIYLDQKAFPRMHGNPYTEITKHQILTDLQSKEIDVKDYQAMYSVPVMEGWNDKFHIAPNFNAEYHSILFSMSTGLPLINAMHSRIGLTDAWKSIQLSSNPLIKKELLSSLELEKPILLLFGKGIDVMEEGEQYLFEKSELVLDQKDYELRSFDLKHFLENQVIDSLRSDLNQSKDTIYTNDNSFYIQKSFDDVQSQVKFSGDGSKMVNKDQIILNEQLPDTLSGQFEVSLFVKLDNKMYGMPIFELSILAKNGEQIISQRFDSFKSKDIQEAWVRTNFIFDIPEKSESIIIKATEINQTFYLDDLTLKSKSSNLIKVNSKEKELLYDNYKIMLD